MNPFSALKLVVGFIGFYFFAEWVGHNIYSYGYQAEMSILFLSLYMLITQYQKENEVHKNA